MSTSEQWEPDNAHLVLEIGTFNVRCDFPGDREQKWEYRCERFLNLLHSWHPDVLGLQEPLKHQRDQISQSLTEYASVGVGRDDGQESGEFCPIFYRKERFDLINSGTFWFSGTPAVPGICDWGSRHRRICTWAELSERASGRSFTIYNLHIDHESQLAREKSVELLLTRIGERGNHDPVIVTGDFNAEPENPALALFLDSPVPTSALMSAAAAKAEVGTFHGFTGQVAGGPIDHIFVSPEWRVVDAKVLPGDGLRPYPSDHLPVSATLSSSCKPS